MIFLCGRRHSEKKNQLSFNVRIENYILFFVINNYFLKNEGKKGLFFEKNNLLI